MRPLLILLLTAITASSQAQKITGSAKDENGIPLAGATVSLIKDSSTVKLAVTNEKGLFSFSGITQGNYALMATYVGYKPAVSSKFSFSSLDVAVQDLKLSKIPASLNNLNVVAKKPMVEAKADRTILNVEGTLNAVGSNALELLVNHRVYCLIRTIILAWQAKMVCRFTLITGRRP